MGTIKTITSEVGGRCAAVVGHKQVQLLVGHFNLRSALVEKQIKNVLRQGGCPGAIKLGSQSKPIQFNEGCAS